MMTDHATKLDASGVSQKAGNLKLATLFIQEYLDDPERFGPIPLGAAVILLPPDEQGDSELRKANLQMADELVAEGRVVVLWTVGGKEPATLRVLNGPGVAD